MATTTCTYVKSDYCTPASVASQPAPATKNATVLEIARALTPNAFDAFVAEDICVCRSTGKKVSIAYHAFGDPSNPLVLLIPGLNAEAIVNYDSATCTWLANQGFYAVRMDNRDTGLHSTKFDDVPQRLFLPFFALPNWMAVGEVQPYTLEDMADDASALIKFLLGEEGLKAKRKAHVVGISMGGMIAQCMALRNPQLIDTLTLVMTNSGNHNVAKPPLSTLLVFLHRPKSPSAEHMHEYRQSVVLNYLVGRRANMHDMAVLDLVGKEVGPDPYLRGAKRQMAAIQRCESRDEALRSKLDKSIKVHIMHGALDSLVPVGNGYHLHKLMPHAKLTIFPEMGHYVDSSVFQEFMETLVGFVSESSS